LDLETREALAVALAQFDGTLVLVSHDRHLLRATTDELLIVANGRLRAFDGDLEDYRELLLNPEKKPVVEKKDAVEKKKTSARPRDNKLESRIKRLEEQIARL